MLGINIRVLRLFMGWTFAIASVVCLVITLVFVLRVIHRDFYALFSLVSMLCCAIFLTLVITFGIAWWTIWTDKPFARGWGLAASSIHVLLPLWMILFRSYSIFSCQGVGLALGVVGLTAFLSRDKVEPVADESELEGNPT